MATWFVTGASRGIGAEIARAALKDGNNVVVAVRNPERVPEDLKASDTVFPAALDVTDNNIPAAVTAHEDAAQPPPPAPHKPRTAEYARPGKP